MQSDLRVVKYTKRELKRRISKETIRGELIGTRYKHIYVKHVYCKNRCIEELY